MNGKKIEWPSTYKRFVAYLDIMGFRDMVFRNDVKTIPLVRNFGEAGNAG